MARAIFLLVLGIPPVTVLVVAALRFRAGRWRSLAGWRKTPEMPSDVRNAVYGFLPGAASILFIFLSMAFYATGSDGLASGMTALAAISFILSMRFSRKPPEWLKPDWVREEESKWKGDNAENEQIYRDTLFDRVIDGVMILLTVVTLGAAVVSMISG